MFSKGPTFLGTFALVFVSTAGIFAFDTFLEKMERSESQTEASRFFEEGKRLQRQGRNAEAIAQYRAALSFARDRQQYQFALATALLASGKLSDAETAVDELLRRDSTDGSANLTMARILVKQKELEDATFYYHRAIYGRWQQNAAQHKVQARLELVDLLAREDAKKELLAELLPLQDEVPDPNTQKRIAHLYLLAGSPARASELFRGILRAQPADADAYYGLGQAEFARGNYRVAYGDFLTALRLKPDNPEIQKQLELSSQVLALDPTRRGLNSTDRYQRSVQLLNLATEDLKGCIGSPPPQSFMELTGRKPSHDAEANLDLAEEVWQVRKRQCKQDISATEQPLALVLAKVAQ